MLGNSYQKSLMKLQLLQTDLEALLEEGLKETKSFENKVAGRIIENLLEHIGDAAYKLKRYSKKPIEGKLQEDPVLEKFELIRRDTGKEIGWYLSCGSYLEVYDQETQEWYTGRVEHTIRGKQKGYYFVCHDLDDPFLYSGMIARVRIE